MATAYNSTIFSSTYKDDFKDSNNFHRILFNSGKTLQARELTQSQTIIQKEIERMGDNLYKEGAMIRPGGVTVNNQIEFIKLDTSTNAMDSSVAPGILNTEFTGASSGVKAKVIDVLQDSGADKPATLYVNYTSTSSGTAGTDPIRMSPQENMTNGAGTTLTVQTTNSNLNPAIGQGTRASVADGDFYVEGHFVNAQPQSKIISRYTTNPNKSLGFVVTQDIVTSADDNTLFDNQGASPNISAPGADRYRIRLNLTTKDLVADTDKFINIANIINGAVTSQPEAGDEYNTINDVLAKRTKEESGNYIAKQFIAKFDSATDSSLTLNISDGIAYVDGYRVQPNSLPIAVDRAQATKTLNNEAIAANYGNFVYVQDSGCDGVNMGAGTDRGARGLPTPFVDSCTIFDAADASGNAIGQCRVKAVEKGGVTGIPGSTLGPYKYYLQNIEMYSGKSFRTARSIGPSSTVFFNPVQDNGQTVLRSTENHDLLFQLPKDRPKALSDFNLTAQRKLTGTTDASGSVTFSTLSNETYVNTTDWIFASVDSAVFVPTADSGSGTTSFKIEGGPKSKDIVALGYINKAVSASAIQRTKTLATVTKVVGPTTVNGVTSYNLAKPDLFDIISIKDNNSSGVDVSSKFIIDNGQRDNHYDLARLILRPGQTQTNPIHVVFRHFTHGAGQFFTAQSYPASVSYSKIPNFITRENKEIELRNVIDFRPVVDSAGKFGSAGFASVVNEIPKNTDVMSADIEYYMPRRDKLVARSDNSLQYLIGQSSFDPKEVSSPAGSLDLYNVNLNAFTINDSDLTLEKIESKRFTMQDIGQIEKRIDRLEETTALSLLEVDTRNFEVIDSSGNNRTKAGFVVDNFANHFQADTFSSEYRAAISPQQKILRPSFWEDNVKLMYDSATSKALATGGSGVVRKGDNLYLEHSHDSAFSNLLATQTENVNPFNVITNQGFIDLSPASDDWKESRKAAPRVLDGGVKIDKAQANNWNNWEWNWSGTEAASLVAGQQLSERQTENQVGNQIITYKQTNFVASNEVIRTFIGTRVIDIALIPFMRSKKIFFRAQGLKANSRMFAFFNGVDVSDWVRSEASFTRFSTLDSDFGSRYNKATTHPSGSSNLTTTDSGSLIGSFFIPNTDSIKFRTGDNKFKLLDISVNQDSAATSLAEATFTSRGILETEEDTILSTRNIKLGSGSREVARRSAYSREDRDRDDVRDKGFTTDGTFKVRTDGDGNITSSGWGLTASAESFNENGFSCTGGYRDPLAQTFMVEEQTGIFVTKVRLFFATKDTNVPVCCEIRPVLAGVPEITAVPGATKFLGPSSVNVAAEGSNLTTVQGNPTDFEFEEPVYLKPYTEYAIVVIAQSNQYTLYTAKSGDFIVQSTERRVTKQPSLGSLFKSQNGSTWTADQQQDMMFTIFKANFGATGLVHLENANVAPMLLDTDPITTTNSSTTVSVYQPGHGFNVGDLVTINGVSTSDSAAFVSGEIGGSGNSGILGSELDGGRTITKVDWTGYQFVADGSAASGTVSGGGSALRASQNMQFDTFVPNVQFLTPPATQVAANAKFHTGKSFGGSETPYTRDTAFQPIVLNKNNTLDNPRLIASRENELKSGNISTTNNPNQRSAHIQIAMVSNNSNVSPVIDLQRTSLTVVNNLIDKQDAAATSNGFSVPIAYKAETDPIEGSSASKHVARTITLAEDAVGLKVIIAANVPNNSSFDLYFKTATDGVNITNESYTLATREVPVATDDNPNIFRDHTFLIGGVGGNLDPFTQFKLKIVFTGFNSSKVPVLRDMRVIALAT